MVNLAFVVVLNSQVVREGSLVQLDFIVDLFCLMHFSFEFEVAEFGVDLDFAGTSVNVLLQNLHALLALTIRNQKVPVKRFSLSSSRKHKLTQF